MTWPTVWFVFLWQTNNSSPFSSFVLLLVYADNFAQNGDVFVWNAPDGIYLRHMQSTLIPRHRIQRPFFSSYISGTKTPVFPCKASIRVPLASSNSCSSLVMCLRQPGMQPCSLHENTITFLLSLHLATGNALTLTRAVLACTTL